MQFFIFSSLEITVVMAKINLSVSEKQNVSILPYQKTKKKLNIHDLKNMTMKCYGTLFKNEFKIKKRKQIKYLANKKTRISYIKFVHGNTIKKHNINFSMFENSVMIID